MRRGRPRLSARPAAEPPMADPARRQQYWSRNLRMTALLLGIWLAVTFVISFYARELNFNFFGWPFSFYMAAQGALVVYIVLVVVYAAYMNRLDRELTGEDDNPDESAG